MRRGDHAQARCGRMVPRNVHAQCRAALGACAVDTAAASLSSATSAVSVITHTTSRAAIPTLASVATTIGTAAAMRILV